MSDFHIINHERSSNHLLSSYIEQFQCLFDHNSEHLILQWSISDPSRFHLTEYLLYYSDITDKLTNDFIRLFFLPISNISIIRQGSMNLFRYKLNISTLDLNSNHFTIVHFHLTTIDDKQHPLTTSGIYCLLPRRYGRTVSLFYSIDCQGFISELLYQ